MAIGDKDKWAVEARQTDKDKWQRQKPPVARVMVNSVPIEERLFSFETTIGHLKKGMPFEYRVLKNESEVFKAQAISKKSAEQPFRFVMFADVGALTLGQKKVAYQVYDKKPDFIICGGDVVYTHGLLSEYLEKFFPVYNAETANPTEGAPIMRSIPTIGVIGNHDIGLGDNKAGVDLDTRHDDGMAFFKIWSEPLNGPITDRHSKNVRQLLGSEANVAKYLAATEGKYPRMAIYSYDYGNSHWLVLDANYYMDWTDEALRAWVDKDLAGSDAKWKFVCFHQPGFSFDASHYKEQRMRLLSDLFEKNHVDVVFAGHAHDYQRSFPLTFKGQREGGKLVMNKDGTVDGDFSFDKNYDGEKRVLPKGIIYIVSGAGGAPLYGPISDKDPSIKRTFTDKFIAETHSFTVCDVHDLKLTVNQVSEDGKVVDTFIIDKSPAAKNKVSDSDNEVTQ
jgi:predicted MPP superfamily phosphohydrolase